MSEAAVQLGLDPTRVRRLIRDGAISGRRAGRMWLVDTDELSLVAIRGRPPGRPLSPQRAWAALSLLAGERSDWLAAPARSQVRAVLRALPADDPTRWRAVLRGRAEVVLARAHPAALPRLFREPGIVASGPALAAELGLDLVVSSPRLEAYVDPQRWQEVARRLRIQAPGRHHEAELASAANLLVRLPRWAPAVAKLRDSRALQAAAAAADCLDSVEPRARRAGLRALAGWADTRLRMRQ